MRTPAASPQRRRAFTLIELMMVVAIIGVLVMLLFPAFKGVMDMTANLQCQSNLRQIGLAVQSYIADNKGQIPPTYIKNTGSNPGDANVQVYWFNILAQRYLAAENTYGLPAATKTSQRSILICPASTEVRANFTPPSSYGLKTLNYPDVADNNKGDSYAQGWTRYPAESGTPPVPNLRTDCSYFWNGQTTTSTGNTQTAPVPMQKRFASLGVDLAVTDATAKSFQYHNISEIPQQSTLVMVADGVAYNPGPPASGASPAARVAARHPGEYGRRSRTNIVFYDGHVESMDRGPNANKTATDTTRWKGDTSTPDPANPLLYANGERSASPGQIPIMSRIWDITKDEAGPPYFMLPRR